MYRLKYAEVLEDDQSAARDRERMALSRSIELMRAAAAEGATAREVAGAVNFTSALWTMLIEDLADSGNMLPKELRGQIISIGIWILRELDGIRNSKSPDFKDVLSVCQSICDGLT